MPFCHGKIEPDCRFQYLAEHLQMGFVYEFRKWLTKQAVALHVRIVFCDVIIVKQSGGSTLIVASAAYAKQGTSESRMLDYFESCCSCRRLTN